eukprot:scaffold1516_cov192-Alexandrium_tamarense.AAC.34
MRIAVRPAFALGGGIQQKVSHAGRQPKIQASIDGKQQVGQRFHDGNRATAVVCANASNKELGHLILQKLLWPLQRRS